MHHDDATLRREEPISIDELKARARALAESESATASVEVCASFLVFAAGGEWFAVPLAGVHEVLRRPRVVPIPHSPAAVRGVVNRRGDIVPVVDLAVLFGRPDASAGDAIVVVGHAPLVAGLVTDGWPEIVEVSEADIGALPHQSRFVRGIWRHGDRPIKILAIEQLIEPDIYRTPQAIRAEAGGASKT